MLVPIVALALTSAAPGGPPMPGPTPGPPSAAKRDFSLLGVFRRDSRPTDWELGSRVRDAFWKDRELASLNLIVVVRQGVAYLHGAAGSEAQRQKAAAVAKSVRGIQGVENAVRVQTPAADKQPQPRQHPPIDQPWPRHDGTWTPALLPIGAEKPSWQDAKPAAITNSGPILPPAQKVDPASTWQPVDGPQAPSRLLPPEADRAERTPTEHAAQAAQNPALYAAVDAVLRGDERFRGVRFRLDGCAVKVSGVLETAADFDALFRLLGDVPNVTAVSSEGLVIRRRR